MKARVLDPLNIQSSGEGFTNRMRNLIGNVIEVEETHGGGYFGYGYYWRKEWLDFNVPQSDDKSPAYDPKEQEAIRASIAKWEKNLEQWEENFKKGNAGFDEVKTGCRDCPLCEYTENFPDSEKCFACPIKKKTGNHWCKSTPYVQLMIFSDKYHLRINTATASQFVEGVRLIVDEINFLESMLVEEPKQADEKKVTFQPFSLNIKTEDEALTLLCYLNVPPDRIADSLKVFAPDMDRPDYWRDGTLFRRLSYSYAIQQKAKHGN